ncbi:Smr/MutS family protein [Geothrix sp. PMB-07]|uniref:endonuclease MutS2 n=1 Tax=Geothrix sp. PMB-07 TaxID=3068640 RepID=UPI0027418F47|nr:Smr/MutS family protein [Geothrix sp. PMB-07]WLT30463.1 Smr/MutS family protein [Geothrix sp. PMB-07]
MNPELEALEFPEAMRLIQSGARTASGRATLGAMHPWDHLAGLRRLHQLELQETWTATPDRLPILTMDEALAELLNPAGWLLPEHWRQLRDGLRALARLLQTLGGLTWPENRPAPAGTHLGIDPLQVTAALLPDPAPLAERLAKSFNEDGQLDPLRIPALASLHRSRQDAFQAVQAKLQKLLRATPDAFNEAMVVERNGRFCLPVRQERRGLMPGLVLDRSGSGATVFVEPMEAVPLNNAFVEADRDYAQAVQAFLRDLLAELRARREDFLRWRDLQARADQALALLRWAALCDGHLPELAADPRQGRLCLLEARHPMLLPSVREAMGLEPLPHPVVPLNLVLEAGKPGLIISGSNTGGKTVVLKTVGLLSALASCGCAVSAKEGSAFPALPSLHADIGDHQTITGSLSTFSSHILHLKEILKNVQDGGLVLLDELGTGTDPKEGAALGIAVLQTLSRRHCWILCSTHLGEISQWALRHTRFQNASVQFDEERLAPTYRLLVGQPGQSRALTIAARLGLPRPVLDHADKVLGKREQDWRDFLRELEAERTRLLEEAESLRQQQAAAEKDQAILRQREEKLREEREAFQRESQEKVARVLDFLDHEGKRLVRELKERQKAAAVNPDRLGTEAHERVKQLTRLAEAELKPARPPSRGTSPQEVREGGHARHKGLGVEGRVSTLKGDRATLETPQGRRLECRLGELEPITAREAAPKAGGRVRVRTETQNVESEINLIGRASDDVDSEIYRFVEEALAAGSRYIRIVHGHGTGKLKAAVREALRGHPGIAGVEDAPQAQGGAGATVITLR